MRYYLTLARMSIINKSTNKNVGKGVEKRVPSFTVGGNVNWYYHYENSKVVPQKTTFRTTIGSSNPGYISGQNFH